MHNQMIVRIGFNAQFFTDTRGHRYGGNTGRPDQRIDFSSCYDTHELSEQRAAGRADAECDQTEHDDIQRLRAQTLYIIVLGLVAFCVSTAGGTLFGKLMCVITRGKINPLIGSAGVSAIPMAARVSEKLGVEANPNNHLIMHAMGANVSGAIGSAVAAGILLALL